MSLDLLGIATWSLAAFALAALLVLHRVREVHHLYIGLALTLVPVFWARVVGALLVLDDATQHMAQAVDHLDGHPVPSDFSPVHRLYVAAARWLIRQPWCPAFLARFLAH